MSPPHSRVPRRQRLLRGLPRRLVCTVAIASIALSGGSAAARERSPLNPLTRHLAGLTVAPAREFRLLTVHLLEAPMTARAPEMARLASTANPDTVGLAFPSRGRVRPTHFDNFAQERTLLLPGDVIRAHELDVVVTDHVIVPGRGREKLPVEALSERDGPEAEHPEPGVLPVVLPPTLRWAFTREIRAREAAQIRTDWADVVGLTTPRRSPADLAAGTVVRERVDEYRQALSRLPRPDPGLRHVGYVALIDGRPIALEVHGAPADFAARWPEELRALAVEAAALEVGTELLDVEMPPSGDPDRFLADVRALTLELHGDAESHALPSGGRLYTVATSQGTLRGLVVDDLVAHLLLLTDPRRRREGGEDGIDPDIVSGRRPQSEFERRFKERLRDGPPLPGGAVRPPTPLPRDEAPPIPR